MFFILLLFISASCFTQEPRIDGHWRPINKSIEETHKTPGRLYRDIVLNSDSTFGMVGDSSNNNSTVPGWHDGEELSGTWSIVAKNVIHMRDAQSKLVLVCRVLKLSAEELELSFVGDAKKGVRCIRLKSLIK